MLPQLANTPSPAWMSAWQGYELDLMSRGCSRATISSRRSAVLIMARWATVSGTEPEQVTKQHMTQYLLAQYHKRAGSGSVVLYVDCKAFWAWYSAEYQVPSPMDGISRPKGKARPVPVLKPGEIKKVMAVAMRSPRDYALVCLMLGSGLRRNEVCALDVADVDLKQRTVVVKCGKGSKARVAVMDDMAVKAIWSYLRRTPGRTGPLFLGRTGCRLSSSGLNQLITRLGAAAGVAMHPHQLRHTWTHYLLQAGMGERNVCTLAGWSSPAMLARYAASAAQERAIAAAQQVQASHGWRQHR